MRVVLVLAAIWGLAACAAPKAVTKPVDKIDPEYLRVFCKAKGGQLTQTSATSSNGRTQAFYSCHFPPPGRKKAI